MQYHNMTLPLSPPPSFTRRRSPWSCRPPSSPVPLPPANAWCCPRPRWCSRCPTGCPGKFHQFGLVLVNAMFTVWWRLIVSGRLDNCANGSITGLTVCFFVWNIFELWNRWSCYIGYLTVADQAVAKDPALVMEYWGQAVISQGEEHTDLPVDI